MSSGIADESELRNEAMFTQKNLGVYLEFSPLFPRFFSKLGRSTRHFIEENDRSSFSQHFVKTSQQ